VSRTPLCHNTQ